MIIIQIRFPKKEIQLPPEGHLIPHPKAIAMQLMSCLDPSYERHNQLLRFLEGSVPFFSIPSHQTTEGRTTLDSTTLYIKYTTTIPKQDWEHIRDRVSRISKFLGNTAAWTVVDKKSDEVPCNCFTYKDGGIEREGFGKTFHYYLNEDLPRSPVSFSAPQRITLSVDADLDANLGLKTTNSFHKYLVKSLPHNYQASGGYMNSRTPDEQSLYYDWIETDGKITGLTISCSTGINDELIEFLHQDHQCHFFQEQLPVSIKFVSNQYYIEEAHNKFKSIKPVFAPGLVKSGITTNPFKSPQGAILNSIRYTLDPTNKTPLYVDNYDYNSIEAVLPVLGRVKVTAVPEETDINGVRGGRVNYNANNAYSVVVETENAAVLKAAGQHRKWGVGKLVPID